MNIDYSKTLSAYNEYDGKMEYLTTIVHDYVLSDDYLGKTGKLKNIVKGIGKIQASDDEMLIQSFVGKLRYKLPALHLYEKLSAFERERSKLIAAGIVTNVLLDSGVFEIREEIKRDPPAKGKKERKFRKHLYIQLGGERVRDYYKGIHLEPGVVTQDRVGAWSLTRDQRGFLVDVASVPYKIWDGCTTELLMHGYSLKEDWERTKDKHGRKLSEDPICKRNRFGIYADKIVNHVKRFPLFYLSMKYDDRYRAYYDAASLEGIRPHGKLWETLNIDSAVPFDLTEEDERVLKHIIYVNIHGRTSVEKAVKLFKNKDLEYASMIEPLEATTEKDFGIAILLNKAAKALYQYHTGEQSTFMFGYDFTNSGLMMAGLSFHSKEMMKSANLGNHKTVFDSHTEFGKSYGLDLPRNEVKKIHTALMHGGTNETLVKEIESVLGEGAISLRQVVKANEKAYGECVRNITAIADWGTIAVGNRQSILRWTMPDKFQAASRSHMEGVPVRSYAASARHKEGYCAYTVVSNMPLVEDKNGFPIYDKHTELDGVHYPVKVKKRGLFANLTHSIDAYVLRCVVAALRAAGRPFLLKHDDYIVPPGAQYIVKQAAQEAFDILYEINVYRTALEEIAAHSPYGLIVPTLYMGKAKNTASASSNFLMP
jgi:hypothetical protein